MLLREFLGVRQARRDRALGGVDPLPAARRRDVGQLPRRSRRAVDDDRGLLGAAPGGRSARRRAHARGGALHPRRRRPRARARVHARVARAVRPVVVGARAGAAAGDRPAALVGAAERLRLRLLGAPDDRGAVARQSPPSRASRCRSTSTSCAATTEPDAVTALAAQRSTARARADLSVGRLAHPARPPPALL